jgi:hypothetical protein
LRKLSLKMLSLETKTQQSPGNAQVIQNQNPPGSGNHLMDAVSGKAWALPYWEVPLRQKKKSPILATNLDMRVQIRS